MGTGREFRSFTALFVVLVALLASSLAGAQTADETMAEADAPPRIPIRDGRRRSVQPTTAPTVPDPACRDGCLIRVPPNAGIPVLWSRAAVAYAAVDADTVAALRARGIDAPVVWPSHDTARLYVLFKVQPGHDRLILSHGTVHDSTADFRLLEANRLPLQVNDLYANGIWVEKLPPPVASHRAESLPPFSLDATLEEIVALGAPDGASNGDRQFDAPGTIEAAEYLYRRFAMLGYDVRFQDFQDDLGQQQLNVVALPPGQPLHPNGVLITAHYDSLSPPGRPAPGADDNASGLAAMLQVADRLARSGFLHPVGFVAFAAEEPGLLGSRDYTARLTEDGADLGPVINLDSIGIPEDGRIVMNGNYESRWIYDEMVNLAPSEYRLEWIADPNFLSDDEYFRRRGYTAVMIATHPWGTEPLHHTPEDTLEHVDREQIQIIADLVWDWLLHYVSS